MLFPVLAIVGVVAVLLIVMYNGLVRLNVKVDEGWADIDTQLKRRYDLIPNIIATVKGYAKHEKDVFVKVTELRAKALEAKGAKEKGKIEGALTEALKTLFAVAENYPQLKANENFLQLQNTLKEIEEQIQLSRRYYNGTVKEMNTKVQIFPYNLIAPMLGFKKRDFFEAGEEERENVKVDFEEEKKKEEK